MGLEYFYYCCLWITYFVIHSVLATDGSKNIASNLGIGSGSYRVLYVVISTGGLLGVLLYGALIPEEFFMAPSRVLKFVGLVLASVGVFVIKLAFKEYSLSGFLGVKKELNLELKTSGILNHIRHPLYTATILLIVGFVLFNPKWTSVVMLLSTAGYLVVGIYLEEKKLINLFGDRYLEYKKRVPGLVPRWKF